MKLLVLVISADEYPYDVLEDAIRETWAKDVPKECEVFFLKQKPFIGECYVDGDTFYAIGKESWQTIGRKTVQSFEYFYKNTDFDYIFRTNLSSYVDLEKLLDFIDNNKIVYDGFIGHHNGLPFSSGAGILISKNTIKTIIDNKSIWRHDIPDDVALAKLLKSFNIVPEGNVRRQTVVSVNDKIDINQYHYRCKQINRMDDVKIIKNIKYLKDASQY